MKNKKYIIIPDENHEFDVDILIVEKANKKLEETRIQLKKINDRISKNKEYTDEDIKEIETLLENVLKTEQDIVQKLEENEKE